MGNQRLKSDRRAAAEMGRKGGARTAQLRREGKLGEHAHPIADAKSMAADVLRWMRGDD